jgi:hypothetical protein
MRAFELWCIPMPIWQHSFYKIITAVDVYTARTWSPKENSPMASLAVTIFASATRGGGCYLGIWKDQVIVFWPLIT